MRVIAALILLTLTASVMAEQYWVEYDPSAGLFPEEVGWTRIVFGGGAERYFEDGALVLDGMASTQIADVYQMCRPGMLDPGAGELFMARWTLRVDELVGYGDAVVVINADDARGVCMMFHEGLVRSLLEPGLHAFFEPHQYHDFELRSSDMETYQLLIDGVAALAGSFKPGVSSSLVGWGDGVIGAASLAHWRGFGFGVVPEPGSLASLVCAALMISARRRARRSSVYRWRVNCEEVP
jgi:hypothetical protein